MRKIIGIGESLLDIIFKNGQPSHSVPGGSTFNTMVSLGRLRQPVYFVSEVGDDHIGKSLLDFMKANHIDTTSVDTFADGKSAISLAFLDNENDAHYAFYTQYPEDRLSIIWPRIDEGDIVIFGSYFAVNPALRQRVCELIEYAKERKAIIYYDPNFRDSHAHEAMKLMPSILENLEYADIVRGSTDDMRNLFRQTEAEKVYLDHIKFYSPNFIYTRGKEGAELFCGSGHCHFDNQPGEIISTIGAGDSFNAGILFGLLKHDITLGNLYTLTPDDWKPIVRYGLEFAAAVCGSYDNYISEETADRYRP